MATIKGKYKITASIKILTGLHIGASSEFSPIGAVDSPFIRDPFTKQPIIPGSSIKGKMRTLLVQSETSGYIIKDIRDDSSLVKRTFGSTDKNSSTRFQFADVFMNSESKITMGNLELDTYIGEIKFENVIQRNSGQANPRQIERVPSGAKFDFTMVYNVEKPDEVEDDMKLLAKGIALLEMDYLGGHGSRGYGRVAFENFVVIPYVLNKTEAANLSADASKYMKMLNNRTQIIFE